MTITAHTIGTRASLGRNEGDLSWFHRHDEYPATRGEPS
jgi:hypothetical protein